MRISDTRDFDTPPQYMGAVYPLPCSYKPCGVYPIKSSYTPSGTYPSEQSLGEFGEIISIPLSVDKWLGNSSEESAVNELGGRLENPLASAYVNGIGQKLAANTKKADYG